MNILLVEDDQSFGYIMKAYLEMHDFDVHWVKNGQHTLQLIRERPFQLCILDIMLPGIDGYSLARRIKEQYPALPFIFLSARALKVDKLKGYRLGCDDYITKPVDEELLIAKIHAILARSERSSENGTPDKIFIIGKYEFDYSNQTLKYIDRSRQLTEKEARLLKMLCDNDHRLVSREQALKEIWGKNDLFNRKTMDVFIHKLRKYLQDDPGVRIRNVHSKGFVLEW